MEKEISQLSRYIKAALEMVEKADRRAVRLKDGYVKGVDERGAWELEKKELLEKVEEEKRSWEQERIALQGRVDALERELRESKAPGTTEEDKIKTAEKKLEEEIGSVKAMTDEQWGKELADRKKRARCLVISAQDAGVDKGRVLAMLKEEVLSGVKKDKLIEMKGRDGLTRWFYELEREEEKHVILERGEKIKAATKLRVGEDRTFIERKTRSILEKTADYERAKNQAAKIRIDANWLCVDGKWRKWQEKEASWIDEKDWDKKQKEAHRVKIAAELASLDMELGVEGAKKELYVDEQNDGQTHDPHH